MHVLYDVRVLPGLRGLGRKARAEALAALHATERHPERGRPTRVLQEEGALALRTGVWSTLYTFDGDVLRIFSVIRIAI